MIIGLLPFEKCCAVNPMNILASCYSPYAIPQVTKRKADSGQKLSAKEGCSLWSLSTAFRPLSVLHLVTYTSGVALSSFQSLAVCKNRGWSLVYFITWMTSVSRQRGRGGPLRKGIARMHLFLTWSGTFFALWTFKTPALWVETTWLMVCQRVRNGKWKILNWLHLTLQHCCHNSHVYE